MLSKLGTNKNMLGSKVGVARNGVLVTTLCYQNCTKLIVLLFARFDSFSPNLQKNDNENW